MVHNGIEYGDMQLICEAYHLMRELLEWRSRPSTTCSTAGTKGPLDSYLIEITRDILGTIDPDTKKPMVDVILDTAGQKGTGKWTVISACDLGVPLTLIGEAVFARCLSAQKDERVAASKSPQVPAGSRSIAYEDQAIDAIEQALYASKIVSYAQGFALMDAMGRESKWEFNKGGVALMWRGGCIIRSAFLGKIKEAFDRDPKLANLLLDPYFRGEVERCQEGWRRTARPRPCCTASAAPAMTSALAYFDGYRSDRLPGQPASSPARLFRRPYLRTGRPPARPVFPHQLDRPRRHDLVDDIQRMNRPSEPGSRRRGRFIVPPSYLVWPCVLLLRPRGRRVGPCMP